MPALGRLETFAKERQLSHESETVATAIVEGAQEIGKDGALMVKRPRVGESAEKTGPAEYKGAMAKEGEGNRGT